MFKPIFTKLPQTLIPSCVGRGKTSKIYRILRKQSYCSSFVWPTAREEGDLKCSYHRGERDNVRKYSCGRRGRGRYPQIFLNRNVTRGNNVSFSRSGFDGLVWQWSSWFWGFSHHSSSPERRTKCVVDC